MPAVYALRMMYRADHNVQAATSHTLLADLTRLIQSAGSADTDIKQLDAEARRNKIVLVGLSALGFRHA